MKAKLRAVPRRSPSRFMVVPSTLTPIKLVPKPTKPGAPTSPPTRVVSVIAPPDEKGIMAPTPGGPSGPVAPVIPVAPVAPMPSTILMVRLAFTGR